MYIHAFSSVEYTQTTSAITKCIHGLTSTSSDELASSAGPALPEGRVGGQPQHWWREDVEYKKHQVACHPPVYSDQGGIIHTTCTYH